MGVGLGLGLGLGFGLGLGLGLVRAPSAALVWPCVFALAPPAATSARRPLGVQ